MFRTLKAKIGISMVFWLVLNIIVATYSREIFSIEPKFKEYKVTFTDPLYEDWTDQYQQLGTTALFDTNAATGVVSDICGSTSGNTPGRAYDQHHGWDRNIPNDIGGKFTVFAIGPGIVEKVAKDCVKSVKNCNSGAGNYVKIRHNAKVVSKVFHLRQNEVFVTENQWVDRYTPIGYGGSTGGSSGEHVHVQIEVDGVAVDPMSLFDDWDPPLIFNLKKCAQDPIHNLISYQSLMDYTLLQMADHDSVLTGEGYVVKDGDALQWLLKDSLGANKKDILVQTYTKLDNAGVAIDKIGVFFDLNAHAPWTIVLEKPVLEWWYQQASTYGPGKPLAIITDIPTMTDQIFFENKIVTYKAMVGMTQQQPYPENACPGMFADGWQSGHSYAIMSAYKQNGGPAKVGYPTGKDAKTAFVHLWTATEYLLQDFGGGSLGSCGIMLQRMDDNAKAYLMHHMMWDVYRAVGNGPTKFGYPLGDQYYDKQFGQNRQDFEKGLSILASGDIIVTNDSCPGADASSTGSSCKCPGNTKATPCGACGNQKWTCQASLWVVTGQCANEGPCAPGKTEVQKCGTCGGTETHTCTSQCKWGEWSVCSKLPLPEVCDNIDNDCDGQIDENVKNVCGGCTGTKGNPGDVCAACSTLTCINGNLTCKDNSICQKDDFKKEKCATACGGAQGLQCDGCTWKEVVSCKLPTPEVCDQLDNDCDGQTDEGNVCGAPCANNACGGCAAFNMQPGDPCGITKQGKIVCVDKDMIKCVEPVDPPPDPPAPPSPPDPPPNPPPAKNACGGDASLSNNPGTSCNFCGTWQCSGANNVTCNTSGVCNPGMNAQQSCQLAQAPGTLCPAKAGTQTNTCTQQCTWQSGACTSGNNTPSYAFETKKVCGTKYCFQIASIANGVGTAKISKPSGAAFGNFPMEWFIINLTTNQTMGFPKGFGCDTYFTGQIEGSLTFSPSTVQSKSSIALKTHSNTNCGELETSPSVLVEKCL